jgi:putative glycosyltransferase (TIGR04372 family)
VKHDGESEYRSIQDGHDDLHARIAVRSGKAMDDATSGAPSSSSPLRRQLNQIRKGGMRVLVRKTKLLLLLAAAFPVVLLMRLLRPLVLIRIGRLKSQRIGHFAANTDIYVSERKLATGNKRTFEIFFIPKPASNRQLELMWQRTLRVWSFATYLYRVNALVPGSERHVSELSPDRDLKGVVAQTGPLLSFTPEEERHGQMALSEMGVPDGAPFACFHVRDSAYLDATYPHHRWDYHSFRDMTLDSFLPVLEALAERGYYMIRLGSVVKQALETTNPRIIDYATQFRTDFLDVYLSAKSRFYLGSDSGIFALTQLFRRPIAMVSVPSTERVHSWGPNDLTIPKKLWLRSQGRTLTFRETIESGAGRFARSDLFEDLGLDVIENSPEEIAALAIEMDERLNGTWQAADEDEELQRRFWSIYEGSELHGNVLARIGAEFLRQNKDLLD